MKKWEELDSKEQAKVLERNVPDEANREAYAQLVSTGPYYFDEQGQVYTHTA